MDISILNTVISAGMGALVAGGFALANKIIDRNEQRKISRENKKDEYLTKKEEAYVGALGYLLNIRRGFDYTQDDVRLNDCIKKEIKESIELLKKNAPLIRLYSSDRIYRFYHNLTEYCQYAYARNNGKRLFEESKEAFNNQITILSRLMQEDLGIRKYDDFPDKITCPECAREHDIFKTCFCGLTFEQLQTKLIESVKIANEVHNNENVENE